MLTSVQRLHAGRRQPAPGAVSTPRRTRAAAAAATVAGAVPLKLVSYKQDPEHAKDAVRNIAAAFEEDPSTLYFCWYGHVLLNINIVQHPSKRVAQLCTQANSRRKRRCTMQGIRTCHMWIVVLKTSAANSACGCRAAARLLTCRPDRRRAFYESTLTCILNWYPNDLQLVT